MVSEKLITICHYGGQFSMNDDGLMSYTGGEAHAVDVDCNTRYQDYKSCVAEFCKCGDDAIFTKYFLPSNKRTLITISCDGDLQRMISFYKGSITTDVYVEARQDSYEECVYPEPKSTLISRESKLLSDPGTPVNVFLDDSISQLTQSLSWKTAITHAGQQFSTVGHFRDALRKYAIANSFSYQLVFNDPRRVTAKCKGDGCPWRIHASKMSDSEIFTVRKLNEEHTCGQGVGLSGHPQATKCLVADIVKRRLKDIPNYKPMEIAKDILQEYGVKLTYHQARRGKELASRQVHGSLEDSYNLLPWLCEKIMATNPGSVTVLDIENDHRFKQLFVSFNASIHGFKNGCRPLIFIDGTPLESTYQGNILIALTVDGNNDFFPIAFAVVASDDDDIWHWFLLQLKPIITLNQPLTFVTKKQFPLCEYVPLIFEDSYHAYCVADLIDNFKRDLKSEFASDAKKAMVNSIYEAAYSPLESGYYECIERVKSISLDAYDWILRSNPNHWANCYFEGKRYNHITLDVMETFNNWIIRSSELPIVQMVEWIQNKVLELIHERQRNLDKWHTILTPSAEAKLSKESLLAPCSSVIFSYGNRFEVRDDRINTVDIEHCQCSCMLWQITGLPCSHAIAALISVGKCPFDYCSKYLTMHSYSLTYSKTIIPITDTDKVVATETMSHAIIQVLPPSARRPPGRPKRKQIESQEGFGKRSLHCSHCNGLGHNKRSCKSI